VASEFLDRLKERAENRDRPVSIAAFITQLKAIRAWGRQAPGDLSRIHHAVLVANGDQDKMVPSSNSVDLARRLPNADLVLYEDAGLLALVSPRQGLWPHSPAILLGPAISCI
jgi:pimeloyl-ACP methyl ester carboxylesterase